MRILFVLENYLPHIGGAEIVFKTLAEQLVQQGHEVRLITHRLPRTKKREMLNGVQVYRVDCFDSRYLFTFFSIPETLRLARWADVIHTTTFNGAFPAWFAAKLRKKPAIITVHEVWVGKWQQVTEMPWFSAKLHSTLEQMIYLLQFDHYACVSRATQQQLLRLGIPPKKTSVVYNGVDYKLWNPNKVDEQKIRKKLGLEKNFVYLFHGRPGVSKGLEYLIRAVPLISRKMPQAKLVAVISQDPAYRKNYQRMLSLIKKLRIKNNVMLLSPVPYKKLPFYVKSADCVIVPSLTEGFGFAAAEACALGVPVIASQTASLPEVVSGKYLLIEPKNPQAIAEAVGAVSRGKYVRSPKKHFYIKDNIAHYLKLYQTLLGR